MQTKPDVSDLLPDIQKALAANSADSTRLTRLLAIVAQRYRQADPQRWQAARQRYLCRFKGDTTRNVAIDLLDRDYPDWRGHRPAYLQQRQSAA